MTTMGFNHQPVTPVEYPFYILILKLETGAALQ